MRSTYSGDLNGLIDTIEVLTGLSIAVDGAHVHGSGLRSLVEHLDNKGSSALTHRVVEAAEAKVGVALMVLKSVGLSVLTTQDLALCDGLTPVGERDSLAVSDSLNQSWALELQLKLLFVNLGDAGRAEVMLEVRFFSPPT